MTLATRRTSTVNRENIGWCLHLHRPGIRLRPGGDYATSELMQGDSHLAIAKPAHPHPDLPIGTHARLFVEIDNEKFMFIYHPNDEVQVQNPGLTVQVNAE